MQSIPLEGAIFGFSNGGRATDAVNVHSNKFVVVGEFDNSIQFCPMLSSLKSSSVSGKSAFWAEYDLSRSNPACPSRSGEIAFDNEQSAIKCSYYDAKSQFGTLDKGSSSIPITLISSNFKYCRTAQIPSYQSGIIAGAINVNSTFLATVSVLTSTSLDLTTEHLEFESDGSFRIGGMAYLRAAIGVISTENDTISVNVSSVAWFAKITVNPDGLLTCSELQIIPDVLQIVGIVASKESSTAIVRVSSGTSSPFKMVPLDDTATVQDLPLSFPPSTELLQPASLFHSQSPPLAILTVFIATTSEYSYIYYDLHKGQRSQKDDPITGMEIPFKVGIPRSVLCYVSASTMRLVFLTEDIHVYRLEYNDTPIPEMLPSPGPNTPSPTPTGPSPTPNGPSPTPTATPITIPTSPSVVSPSSPPVAPTSTDNPAPQSQSQPAPLLGSDSGLPMATKWLIATLVIVLVAGAGYLGYRYWVSKQIARSRAAHLPLETLSGEHQL